MARLFPMMALETKVRSFTANATWTAPLTTTSLISATGKGAAGTPSSTVTYSQWYLNKYQWTQAYYADGTSEAVVYPGPLVAKTTTTESAPKPAPYCDPQFDAGPSYSPGTKLAYCYHYTKTYETSTFTEPATTGASATAFSKTFPGGTGGPATPVTFDNVPVTPGDPYNIVVPAGGSITITYLE